MFLAKFQLVVLYQRQKFRSYSEHMQRASSGESHMSTIAVLMFNKSQYRLDDS